MTKFYEYIYREKNGYRIMKDNIHYGYYEDIADALYDRDNLVACNWDIEEWVWLPETPNKYKDMRLPPWELDKQMQYVYPLTYGNGYRILKKINGKSEFFGNFKTLDEALKRRDELIKNGWCK